MATGEAGLVVGERVTATVEQNTMCYNGGSGCVFGDRAGGLLHGNSLTHNAMLGLMVSGFARPDCRENSLQHNQQGGVDADSLDFLAEVCVSTQPFEPTTVRCRVVISPAFASHCRRSRSTTSLPTPTPPRRASAWWRDAPCAQPKPGGKCHCLGPSVGHRLLVCIFRL